MKHYIFILAMLLNAVAIHAQEPMSIPQLMEYLEKNYPEGMYGGISNHSKTMHENISWGKSYERDKDKPIDKYHLELLKDSILQCFIHASETAIASLYQQTSNGTEDTIRYALALDTLGGNWELIQPEHRNFHYKSLPTLTYTSDSLSYHAFSYSSLGSNESAEFVYLPGRDRCSIILRYHPKEKQIKGITDPIDMQPVQAMIERLSEAYGGVKYEVSYLYDWSIGDNNSWARRPALSEKIHEGSATGRLYVFPKKYADLVPHLLHNEVRHYLKNNNDDKGFQYHFPINDRRMQLSLSPYHPLRKFDAKILGRKDRVGRYTLLFVDHVDSTFALPQGYESMLSYDHGKIKYLPDFHPSSDDEEGFDLFDGIVKNLGLTRLRYYTNPHRVEAIGGDTFRYIHTWQWEISRDSVNSIKKRIMNSSFPNMLYRETHTAEGDTLELTAESVNGRDKKNVIFKFYGKGDRFTSFYQSIATYDNGKIAEPFNTQWVNDFIQQMTDSAYIEEHEVHYEYGKKSDPSSMGKVSGRLYVQTIDKGLYYKFLISEYNHINDYPQQAFDIVETHKYDRKFNSFMRVTDRILCHETFSSGKMDFQLLVIDHVDGKYLIPDEWWRITDYSYGKKTYLKE